MENIYKISDIIDSYISGDWGNDCKTNETPYPVYCVRGADIVPISNSKYNDIPLRYVSMRSFQTRCLQEGDIIIEKSGGSPTQSTGRVVYVSKELLATKNNIVCSNFCTAFRVKKDWNAHYVFLYLQNVYNSGVFFNFEGKTSGLKNLMQDAAFKSIPIKKITIAEQTALAYSISAIDKKLSLNRQINDNLEQQAQALFKSWFVDFEPFRGGEFVDSALGSTPKELPIVYIEDIPHNIESGKRPKGGATFEGVPSIGAENIKGLGYYDYSKTKYIPKEYAQTIKKGKINGYELLIYKDGGKPGYFIPNFSIFGEGFPFNEMYINEHVFILDLMDNAYNAFAYFYMRTPYIMNQLNSIGGKAAIPGINTKDIECLPIYSNESPYVKRYGDIVLPFIKTILSNSLENARLAKMRDTLLPQLMSGELKISE